MDWGFMVLSMACAVFLAQILLEYNRQSNDLRPQIRRVENEVEGQSSEREKHIQMSDGLRAHIVELEAEVAELEAKRAQVEKILQAKQAEDGEKPKSASA